MKRVKLDKKGFTLIELLVTLAIAGVVLSLVFSFFIMNIKNFNRSRDEIDILHEAQYTMEFITDMIVASEEIYSIKDSYDTEVKNTSQELINPSQITFKIEYLDEGDNISTKNISIEYDDVNKSISADGRTIGSYINEIRVLPIPSNANYEDARGLKLTIELSKTDEGGTAKTVTSNIIFRNYQ